MAETGSFKEGFKAKRGFPEGSKYLLLQLEWHRAPVLYIDLRVLRWSIRQVRVDEHPS